MISNEGIDIINTLSECEFITNPTEVESKVFDPLSLRADISTDLDSSVDSIDTVLKKAAAKKSKSSSVVSDLDIQCVILEDPLRSSINVIYQHEKKFDSSCQSKIVAILSNHLLKKYCP